MSNILTKAFQNHAPWVVGLFTLVWTLAGIYLGKIDPTTAILGLGSSLSVLALHFKTN